MDGRIDEIREAIEGLLRAANHNVGGMVPGVIATWCHKALAALSAIDPESIRREFWDELHAEAETQYDRRLELLGPIETLDDAAFRKTLGDGWSAWLLAKKIIENRRAAILSAEPAQDDGKPEVGDVVAWVNSGGDIRVGQFGIEITQGDAVVISRRAEVKRRIEEAKE